MNNPYRKFALAAVAASAIALGTSTSQAAVALYPWVAAPTASHSNVMHAVTRAHDLRVRSTAWSPEECAPGGYWYMYRSGQASVPIACDGTRMHHIL